MGKGIEVTYIKDECYPVYSLDCDSRYADGTTELTKTFLKRFQEAEELFWGVQNELDDIVCAQEKKNPRQKKRGE